MLISLFFTINTPIGGQQFPCKGSYCGTSHTASVAGNYDYFCQLQYKDTEEILIFHSMWVFFVVSFKCDAFVIAFQIWDNWNMISVGHYKQLSTQRPGSPKNTTQHHDVSVQSTLDRRPMYYSQKMDPSSPNANSIMWTHTSLEINFKIK